MPGRAIACPISRHAVQAVCESRMAIPSCGSMWVTASVTNMHEPPEVPNFGNPGHGPRLLRGMTIAVEPMVNAGTAAIRQMPDGWTVKTADGKNGGPL